MRKLMLAALLLALGCGDSTSGPDDLIPAELVSEWVAEQACAPPCAFTLTSTENPAAQLDAVEAFGFTVRIRITAAGRFTRGGTGDPAEGTVRVEGGALIVTDTHGVVDTIDYQIQGQYLHLDFRREFVEMDFDGDGQADPARVAGVFLKRP